MISLLIFKKKIKIYSFSKSNTAANKKNKISLMLNQCQACHEYLANNLLFYQIDYYLLKELHDREPSYDFSGINLTYVSILSQSDRPHEPAAPNSAI